MSLKATLAQLIEATQATPHNLADPLQTVEGITTDSRTLQAGQVFVALRGEKFDGHGFVTSAIGQGAIVAIVDRAFAEDPTHSDSLKTLPCLVVADTLKAYQAIGRWWRRQFQIPVIAITGSVGKTTTKELIAAALSQFGKVLKSQANFNNEIGVPKTLLELDETHDFAVVEMGMRGRGQIAELAQIAEPTIGLITTVGTAHIELLGSREAIAEAKCELFAELSRDGLAIFNGDNALLVQTAATVWQGRQISYGFSQGDLRATLIDPETIEVEGQRFPLPIPGEHNAINYLGTLAVLRALGLSWEPLKSGLAVDLPGGRAKRYELPGDIVLLDETYNAGLESMLAALKLLSQTPGQRHFAVLGTMRELGDYSVPFHRQVGEAVRNLHLDRLFILAEPEETAALVEGATPVPAEAFLTHENMAARLREFLQAGDRVLFKASRAVGLERVVEALRQS